jgi:septum formation topological specificity factor MinE
LAHLYYGKHKPLILFGDFWHEVIDVICKHFFIGQKEMEVFKIVKNQDELFQAIQELESELVARA